MVGVNQDQKKRTLEALERRFAVAKAEHLHQQHNTLKRARVDDDKLSQSSYPSSSDTALAPSSNTSHKKGNFSFSGYTKLQDTEANSSTYAKLCHPVHENLLIAGKNTIDNVLHELLQSGDSAQKYMQGSRTTKIDNWILLDNFVQAHGPLNSAMEIHSKRSKKHMSMKQHKKCGSLELPLEAHKFEVFKPMHDIWKTYIAQLLKSVGKNQLAQCLISADLHGAMILVADCKINSFVGVSGIMIRETAETLGIITEKNKFRVVPKKSSVFILKADSWKVTLLGDKLAGTSLSS